MSYIGHFRDIDETLYTVDIITSVEGTTEITLSDEPFVTSMEESKDNMYRPARYQGATVGIVSSSYLPDIYSATAKGTLVRLSSGGVVKWVGYATPCLYTMGYANPLEVIEVECIDALSVLQYVKYSSADKGIVTLRHIIDKCLAASVVYNDYYVADTLQLSRGSSIPAIDRLHVSEGLFFGVKSGNDVDDDVAWTMQEVLENVATFLGLTMYAEGTSVYFADYDAIKSGTASYWHYYIGSAASPQLVTSSVAVNITGDSHAKTGASISLGDTYNAIRVRDSLYTFDEAIPSFFDNVTNITAASDPVVTDKTYQDWVDDDQGASIGEIISYIDDSENKYMECLLTKYLVNSFSFSMAVLVKYYNSTGFVYHKYSNSGTSYTDITESVPTLNWTQSKSIIGATAARIYTQDAKYYPVIAGEYEPQYGETVIDALMRASGVTHISLSDYICLFNPIEGHISNENEYRYPFIEMEPSELPALFGGEHAYLLISGSYLYNSFDAFCFPTFPESVDISEGRYYMKQEDCYLPCRLQWGDLYWNGEQWTSTASNFKLFYFDKNSSNSDRRADQTMGKDLPFVNTVTWRAGTEDKGLLVPMPVDRILTGKPRLTVYKPHDPEYISSRSGSSYGQFYKHRYVFLKDFRIKALVSNPAMEGEEDTDTEYMNVIDRANVNELDAIMFKLCTWDYKNPNYSAVAYSDNISLHFLDKTFNSALYAGEQSWESSDDDAPSASNGLRQEEHMIYRLWNQYQAPALKETCYVHSGNSLGSLYTITSHAGKVFIADTVTTDYRMKRDTLKLIEKK